MRGWPSQLRPAAVAVAVIAGLALFGALAAPPAAGPLGALMVLYDGAAGAQTPAEQGFVYYTIPQPAAAQVSYANGATTLNTLPAIGDLAGYVARPEQMPVLSRTHGFTVSFTVQLAREIHQSEHRAGLSLLVLADDVRGIELGLWEGAVWAQNGSPALFTRGENAPLDLTSRPVAFVLTVRGDGYTLTADGVEVLAGAVRDYSSAAPPFYRVPNLFFLGDNTSRAAAEVRISYVAVEAAGPSPIATPTVTPTLPPAPADRPIRVSLPLLR